MKFYPPCFNSRPRCIKIEKKKTHYLSNTIDLFERRSGKTILFRLTTQDNGSLMSSSEKTLTDKLSSI